MSKRKAQPKVTYCEGYRAEIFQPGFPYVSMAFTTIGALWWRAHLTDDQIATIKQHGYSCNEVPA